MDVLFQGRAGTPEDDIVMMRRMEKEQEEERLISDMHMGGGVSIKATTKLVRT